MKTYTGYREPIGQCVVRVCENGASYALPWRLDLRNHSPSGFDWGFFGPGPAQLALAILADCLLDDARALRHYAQFMLLWAYGLDAWHRWEISEYRVRGIVRRIETDAAADADLCDETIFDGMARQANG